MRNFILLVLSNAAIIPFGTSVLHADPMSMPAMPGLLAAIPICTPLSAWAFSSNSYFQQLSSIWNSNVRRT